MSFKVIDVLALIGLYDRRRPVLVVISSMSVPICNHFHAKRANTCKITFLKGVLRLFVHGNPFDPAASNSVNEILDSSVSYGENLKSLSHLCLNDESVLGCDIARKSNKTRREKVVNYYLDGNADR